MFNKKEYFRCFRVFRVNYLYIGKSDVALPGVPSTHGA